MSCAQRPTDNALQQAATRVQLIATTPALTHHTLSTHRYMSAMSILLQPHSPGEMQGAATAATARGMHMSRQYPTGTKATQVPQQECAPASRGNVPHSITAEKESPGATARTHGCSSSKVRAHSCIAGRKRNATVAATHPSMCAAAARPPYMYTPSPPSLTHPKFPRTCCAACSRAHWCRRTHTQQPWSCSSSSNACESTH
jgi:hypothetical protein